MVGVIGIISFFVKDDLFVWGEWYFYFQVICLLCLFEKNMGVVCFENLCIWFKLLFNFLDNDVDSIEVCFQGGYCIMVNFFGLYGVVLLLLIYYIEDFFDEECEGGYVQCEFIDIVYYVLYLLFFEVWFKYWLEQWVVEDGDVVVFGYMFFFVGLDEE